jgi:PAS domain S-box-containing protein
MKTAILLSSGISQQQLFSELLGQHFSFIMLAPPAEGSRENYQAMFRQWLPLADAVIVDAASLGGTALCALDSLRGATVNSPSHLIVIVRVADFQQAAFEMPATWLVMSESETVERSRKSLQLFLELRETQAKLRRNDAAVALRQPTGPLAAAPFLPSAGRGFESYRYRDALKTISRVLGHRQDHLTLATEFLRLVHELLGCGKLAVFSRPFHNDWLRNPARPAGNELRVVASVGISRHVADHMRLSTENGLGAALLAYGRIVQRSQVSLAGLGDFDEAVARELDLLGAEFAVPVLDNDLLVGVLTFGGKITGEPVTNEELELIYHLMGQLAQALRNVSLLDQVDGQQKFIADVFRHVPTGIVVIGQDGRLLTVNRSAGEMLGLAEQDLAGLNATMLPGLISDAIFEALQTGQEVRRRELTLPRTNKILGVTATRFEVARGGAAANGKTTMLVGVGLIEDITQEKLHQQQARELEDREFFMRLASRMSHELKNSLVSVKIFAQLLPEKHGEKEFRDQFSNVVTNEINRVDVLVNNLTFFAHPLDLVREEILVSEWIETSVNNIAEEFQRKKLAQLLAVGDKAAEGNALPVIQIKRNFEHKQARFSGDRLRLGQALEHILRNAVQSMANGGRLVVSTSDAVGEDFPDGKLPEGGAVCIEVMDTGEGISLENLPRVSDPFVTTRNVGVGLGLTIVKKIVERHNGAWEIDSQLGKGTTVTLVLPVMAQSHPEDELVARLKRSADDRQPYGRAVEMGNSRLGNRAGGMGSRG